MSVRKTTASEIAAQVDPPEVERDLRARLERLTTRLNEYKQEHGSVKNMIGEMLDAVQTIKPPKITYTHPEASKIVKPVAVVEHLTDWHMGAVQDADEIEGFNEFSPAILKRHILDTLPAKVLSWTETHRKSYTVDELVILCTGDYVSGDIHDELRVTNEFPTPVQCVEAGNLLAAHISKMSPHFPRIVVHAVTADNHGRLTRKPQHKEGGYNTWNYPLFEIARTALSGHENVEFNVYPKEQQVVTVKGRRYLIMHGHQVQGWMGFPYYGIERKAGKEAVKRMRNRREGWDRIIMGHWHTSLTHPWFWIGASASGTDAYDHAAGRESDPGQSTWLVHPDHGEFDRTDWILT